MCLHFSHTTKIFSWHLGSIAGMGVLLVVGVCGGKGQKAKAGLPCPTCLELWHALSLSGHCRKNWEESDSA
jgi:hypothetical protein